MGQEAFQEKSFEPDVTRDLDPNVRQRIAANPTHSVWVSASAGTGKTKVLTDRVLRLMLPRDDRRPGTQVSKILCLTFTKAAASEMALRISKTLGRWAILPEKALEDELRQLLGRETVQEDLEAARRLFAETADIVGGLKIMTIHSFCQSLLGRFPLEAGLPPYFSVLDEKQASELLVKASEQIFSDPVNVQQELQRVAQTINEAQFARLIQDIAGERHQFIELLQRNFGIEGLYSAIADTLGVEPGQAPEDIISSGCQDQAFNKKDLESAFEDLETQGTKTDKTNAGTIRAWIHSEEVQRVQSFETYQSVFFTKDSQPRAKLASKKVSAETIESLQMEMQRLAVLREMANAARCALLTRDLLALGEAILDHYQGLKTQQAALDFDDLIFKTEELLKTRSDAAWVLFKLDQGLEHILIDEAQDTNPEQWKIIDALCSEFFSGKGQSEETRTVFTVGDEKQSIYSFQRASPEEFVRMQKDFGEKIIQAKQNWQDLDLNISFRSTKSVLSVVDAVFASAGMRKGLGLKDIKHHAFRRGQAGHVELWPLCASEDTDDADPWALPTAIVETQTGTTLLAEKIAEKIGSWIENKEKLPSKDRPIRAGDIMVLVRTRTNFVNQLTRALKQNNIPVSGVDRMILSEQLAIEDLVALAEFSLLPADDLTLACVLKTPLIGLSEEELYELSIDRSVGLYQSLRQSTHKDIYKYLQRLIDCAADSHPYEFFSEILQKPCPADNISGLRAIRKRLGDDALDPLDELLSAALSFEHHEIASLQNFLHSHNQGQSEIKRELSEHTGQVRIMTVHGAKGLQAPIVIMPDTVRTTRQTPNQSDKRLIWPNQSELNVPLWSPRKEYDCEEYKTAMAEFDERQEEEYRRLLYVAMTRAEDQLYVCGYQSLRKPLEQSWYNFIEAGLKSLPDTEELEDGTLVYNNPQTASADGEKESKEQTSQSFKIPQCLKTPAPDEPYPPFPLVPSRPSGSESPATSPLRSENTYRFRRGLLTHKLLEILPNLESDDHEAAAKDFITRYGQDLSDDIRQSIVAETLKILNDADFAKIFGPGSQAEVPISGLMPDGRLVSGQIDRLLITDQEIWVVDYKTNRPPPEKPANIPEIYRTQMQAYADTLRQIYPKRQIHSALLWTDGPLLMRVETD